MHLQSRSKSFVAITRLSAAFITAVFLTAAVAPAAPYVRTTQALSMQNSPVRFRVKLHNGQTATVYVNGMETLTDANGKIVRRALAPVEFSTELSRDITVSKGELLAPLLTPKPPLPFAPNQLIVVFASGDAPAQDVVTVPRAELAKLRAAKPAQLDAMAVPEYSGDGRVNHLFAQIGVDKVTRIARYISRSQLSMLRSRAMAKSQGFPLLDIANAFVVHITNAPIDRALSLLRKEPGLAYAEHNYYVSTLNPPALVLGPRALAQARERELRLQYAPRELRPAQSFEQHDIPTNYAVSASAQSLLNAPGVDAVRAYDEIGETYQQLPGQGETIANVSLGDIDDTANPSDPCYEYSLAYGPSVHLIGRQHYIDWPSMPLIPAYVVDSSGIASGSESACGVDPSLGEVGLDFSMMAPLPHQLQRPGEVGSGYSDLLGVAPGAHYQLFVPQAVGTEPATSDILATFLAAADQPKPPSVITSSIGFGFDSYGFPGRFFEDDPLVESTIADLVNGFGIVVCLSANDGIRLYTNVAIGSSGGSAATELVKYPAPQTDLEDVESTTIQSQDYDSGSIDVGGTTLDDIFAAPQNGSASSAKAQNRLTWPETRWTGFASFSSGFGSRVNISAPSDNVLAMSHAYGGSFEPYDAVDVGLQGGTSASAPEVAAVAAVALQLARLTGHPFSSPQALRSFLIKTARTVPNVPQADTTVNVGPQVDLGNVVDTLLAQGGKHPSFAAPRVAIAQRAQVADTFDTTFTTDTAPALIDMQGPYTTDLDSIAPITIAPDWEGVPAGAKYRLTINGKPTAVLATTPWVRLTPAQILGAAGLPLASSSNRTVQLQYVSYVGPRQVQTGFSLTFGPADSTHGGGTAPVVAPVTSGSTLSVSYNIAGVQSPLNPMLIVSEPGRMIPTFAEGYPGLFHASYSVPLTKTSGTVQIPVSALQGAGVYGLQIQYGPLWYQTTDFAFTRVERGSSTEANAPTLSSDGVDFSHNLGLNYAQQYQVHWDVSNVPNATGAIVEISPPAPNDFGSYNSFNNPNGSIPDNNGYDTGSVYKKSVSGTKGTVTLNAATTLTPALWNTIRVIPMNGSASAGEASPVSSISEDGIVPTDGLPLESYTAGNGPFGSITTLGDSFGDAFTLSEASPYATAIIPLTVGSTAPYFLYPNGTVFSGGYQVMQTVFYDQTQGSGVDGEIVDNNMWDVNQIPGTGVSTDTSPFALPTGVAGATVAYNRESNLAAWNLVVQTGTNPVVTTQSISSMTLPSTTFGTLYNAMAAYYPTALYGVPYCTGPIGASCIGENFYGAGSLEVDPGLNAAVLEVGAAEGPISDPSNPCAWHGHVVSTISLANGNISTFATGGSAYPTQSSYDPNNHVLVSPDACGNLVISNVSTQTNKVIPLGSSFGSASGGTVVETPVFDVVDGTNHLILLGYPLDPSFTTNNAAMSLIQEYDENGNLRKSFRDVQYDVANGLPTYLQINENTRTMFVPELTDTQIQPLTY
jgi:hypothetical protein